MKLQHKSTLLIFSIGTLSLILASILFFCQSRKLSVENAQISSQEIAEENARHIAENMKKDAHVASTLANSNLFKQALALSNSEFARLDEEEREQKITKLNKKWMGVKDVNSPFIQSYMTNPVSTYLKDQQKAFPEFYGEIFLTNRYGVIIATTKKLTTLAHSQKYWWSNSYNEGKGRIFFDDRGYDQSVKGYVLGVVVPVKKRGEIIGILKCNIKILGPYSQHLNEYTRTKPGTMCLVRSGGLIIIENNIEPLSRKVSGSLIEKMESSASSSMITTLDDTKQIISLAQVPITGNSTEYCFGGKQKSVDQKKGNLGEQWFVILSRDFQEATAVSKKVTQKILFTGFVLILLMAYSAWLLGRRIARPITKLAKITENINKDDFDFEVEVTSKDELSALTKSFNNMLARLQKTTTSRDKLLEEIDLRKQVEEALNNNQNFLNSIIDQSPFATWISDKKGTIIKCNIALKKLINVTDEQLVGKYNVFEDEIVMEQGLIPKIRSVFEDGKTANFSVEWDAKDLGYKDTNKVHIEGTMFPIHDDKGNLTNVVNHWIDVTKQKQAEILKDQFEAQLQQAQKMEAIGTLAGGVAHDFNNILGAIIGYTEMALDDSPAGSSVANDLDKVLEASGRAADLVRQILSFSRQDDTEYILLQPASIVKKTITMLRPTLPATIEITQDIDIETSLIFADPTQIHQIMLNLCTNAFHAMEETGGRLEITLKEIDLSREDITAESHINTGIFIQLSVCDSGPGMTQEVKDKIFDPYFTTKGVGKGTGMGLSIVDGIIKSYGGFLTFTSEPGKGTSFHIFLPVVSENMLPDKEAVKQIPVGKEKVLFIDDEDLLADMGKDMLERLGYHVTVRKSSLEALETFQNQPDQFDLVITDQTMPGMTGVDLARRMLQVRSDIPIILCTGYSSIISEEKAKIMGIREFAMKPLSKKDIAVLIRKVLDGN